MKKPTKEEIEKIAGDHFKGEIGVEHYKLLAWLSFQCANAIIVEIGTHAGNGARALAFNRKNHVYTFDIKEHPKMLSLPLNVTKSLEYDWDVINQACIIFYDAKHDGNQEKAFLNKLKKMNWRGVIVWDDIHLNPEMKKFWDSIDIPKEDWTDIGHKCGTGVTFMLPNLIKHDEPLSFFIDKINKGKQFKFMRFGDGEWHVHRGHPKMIGKDEHNVFPELTEDIRYIVNNLNPYDYNGLQSLSCRIPHIAKIIPKFNWYNSDVFHRASGAGELQPFLDALKGKNVVIVSSARLNGIEKYIDYVGFIEVRAQDCYHDKEMVLEKMKAYPPGTIFLFCASRLSVPAIYHSDRTDCTMIDCGSLLDPYVGVVSRNYHKKVHDLLQHTVGDK